jgi:hypothetical protein
MGNNTLYVYYDRAYRNMKKNGKEEKGIHKLLAIYILTQSGTKGRKRGHRSGE